MFWALRWSLDVMRGWDRAGVKEGYRRRETKRAERSAWRKLMGNCCWSEAGARMKTWRREMLPRREKNLRGGMQLFARWIAQARAAYGGDEVEPATV